MYAACIHLSFRACMFLGCCRIPFDVTLSRSPFKFASMVLEMHQQFEKHTETTSKKQEDFCLVCDDSVMLQWRVYCMAYPSASLSRLSSFFRWTFSGLQCVSLVVSVTTSLLHNKRQLNSSQSMQQRRVEGTYQFDTQSILCFLGMKVEEEHVISFHVLFQMKHTLLLNRNWTDLQIWIIALCMSCFNERYACSSTIDFLLLHFKKRLKHWSNSDVITYACYRLCRSMANFLCTVN